MHKGKWAGGNNILVRTRGLEKVQQLTSMVRAYETSTSG